VVHEIKPGAASLPAAVRKLGGRCEVTAISTSSGTTLTVTTASFTVNVESLTSDQSMRDSHLQTLGLESAQFPHATFVLASPVT
jgi:polyisoprenoid-binding protein YceI